MYIQGDSEISSSMEISLIIIESALVQIRQFLKSELFNNLKKKMNYFFIFIFIFIFYNFSPYKNNFVSRVFIKVKGFLERSKIEK